LLGQLGDTLCGSYLSTGELTWEYGWLEGKLGDSLSILESGRRPPGGVANYSSGMPSLGAESIKSAGQYDFTKIGYVPEEFAQSMTKGALSDLDILLYKDGGTPGNFEPHVSAFGAGFPFDLAVINEHVYRIRTKPPYSQEFLYFWLRSARMMDEMRRRGTGAAIPGLNSSSVKDLPIIIPPSDLLSSLQLKLDPLLITILRLAKQSRELELTRNFLLPELLSGRIRAQGAPPQVAAI
jgi:type I restriction enzyme S subunit